MSYRTAPEGWWQAFVSATPARTAKAAITLSGGHPHVTPVWTALEGSGPSACVLFTTGASTAKGRALRRDRRLSLCWDDDRPPFSFVTVLGTAALVDDPVEVRHWAGVIGGRYMGADRAEEFGRRNGVPGELLVRVSVEKVIAYVDVAG